MMTCIFLFISSLLLADAMVRVPPGPTRGPPGNLKVFNRTLSNQVLVTGSTQSCMLNRERVNKGTKRMNSLPLSPLVISFILRDIYWENCCLQILRDTEALDSYLGLSALSKNFFCLYKI